MPLVTLINFDFDIYFFYKSLNVVIKTNKLVNSNVNKIFIIILIIYIDFINFYLSYIVFKFLKHIKINYQSSI